MIETSFVDAEQRPSSVVTVEYTGMSKPVSAGLTLQAVIAHLCAFVVAGIFVFAAQSKILDPRQFSMDIRNYHILPVQLTNLAAIFLPWLEVGAAVMILIPQFIGLWGWIARDTQVSAAGAILLPRMVRAGAVLLTGMLIIFICAISYATLMGYDIGCGCFGHDSGKVGLKTLLFDIALLLMTFAAYYFVPDRFTPRPTRV